MKTSAARENVSDLLKSYTADDYKEAITRKPKKPEVFLKPAIHDNIKEVMYFERPGNRVKELKKTFAETKYQSFKNSQLGQSKLVTTAPKDKLRTMTFGVLSEKSEAVGDLIKGKDYPKFVEQAKPLQGGASFGKISGGDHRGNCMKKVIRGETCQPQSALQTNNKIPKPNNDHLKGKTFGMSTKSSTSMKDLFQN
jgi:hypothetical protein